MYFSYYKKRFPDHVLVYIEEFNKQNGTVLFDFIDSNEYNLFNGIFNRQANLDKPSMVFLNNYTGRTIRENTIYSIRPEIIYTWQNQVSSSIENVNSFLIGYLIDVKNLTQEIFESAVSLNDLLDFQLNYHMLGNGNLSQISFHPHGNLSVTIRNVGQGNWNEISFNNEVKVAYDVGAPLNVSKSEVIRIIGNRTEKYAQSRPVLVLSHWDKDHYHSLLGMGHEELSKSFSAFVCRSRVPNLTSRILFKRISIAVGDANTCTIPADQRLTRGGPTFFRNVNPETDQIVIYNAQYHKNRNISGLILSIKSRDKSVILSGDAHYEQISRDILQQLSYKHQHCLVVPHHGGRAGKYSYNIPAGVSPDKAIISVGVNPYGHPYPSYVNALKANGFLVQRTNRQGNDITINL